MSLLWFEGFDAIRTSGTGLDTTYPIWDANVGTMTINTTGGRNSGSCIATTSSSTTMSQKNFLASPEIILGMALKVQNNFSSSANSQSNRLLTFMSGTTNQITIGSDNTANKFNVRTGTYNGSILGVSSEVLPTLTWMYIEVHIVVNAVTGSVRIYKDGVEVLALTGINTDPAASGAFDKVQFYAPAWTPLYDDIYLLGGSGLTRLGDMRVDAYVPTSDGTYNEWTKSTGSVGWSLIDELIQSSVDHIASSVSGQRQSFLVTVPVDGRVIHGVQLSAFVGNPEGGSKGVRPLTINGMTETVGDEVTVTVPARIHQVWEVNPDTGVAWTQADLDAAEFGYEIPSPSASPSASVSSSPSPS